MIYYILLKSDWVKIHNDNLIYKKLQPAHFNAMTKIVLSFYKKNFK